MKVLLTMIVVCALMPLAHGQTENKKGTDQPEAKTADTFYKLGFAIYELEDGKRTNQREYSMIGHAGGPSSSVRVSTRVPILTQENKIQYIDAGLEIRCTLKEMAAGKLPLQCNIDISNFVQEQQSPVNNPGPGPVLRSTNANTWALLVPGKPAVMSTVDDVNSRKRVQIEVTAIKID